MTLDTGSAMKTPIAPYPSVGRKNVSGTTMITFRKMEKKIACFLLFKDLKTVCPQVWNVWNIKAAK